MTGTVWDQLRDYKLATGDYHITRDDRVKNLAGYQRYMFNTLLMNNGAKKSIQGGDEMNFSVMFDLGNTYDHPLPASFRQWKRVDNTFEVKQRWAKNSDHKTWMRDEIIRNKKRGGASWFDVLFDMDQKLEQRLQASRDKGHEDDLAAVPDYLTMESRTTNTQVLPCSIFGHVNENALGIFGAWVNTTDGGATAAGININSAVTPWLTKQQFSITTAAPTTGTASATAVNAHTILSANLSADGGYTGAAGATTATPATSSKFSPTQERYSSTAVNSPNNFFGKLRSAFRKCQWEAPADTRQWYEVSQMNNFRICTSDLGVRAQEQAIKNGQDRWILGPQDIGIPEVQVHGIPILWWPVLDTIAIYNNAIDSPSSLVTESAAADKGARFYGFNGNVLYPVTHEDMWNYREAMPPHFNVPDVFVEYIEDWWNIVCEDYRQHFVVSPRGDMSAMSTAT